MKTKIDDFFYELRRVFYYGTLLLYYNLKEGKWEIGFKKWAGKPKFAMGEFMYTYYLHLGKFYLTIDFDPDVL